MWRRLRCLFTSCWLEPIGRIDDGASLLPVCWYIATLDGLVPLGAVRMFKRGNSSSAEHDSGLAPGRVHLCADASPLFASFIFLFIYFMFSFLAGYSLIVHWRTESYCNNKICCDKWVFGI